jgi:hypothetical protein
MIARTPSDHALVAAYQHQIADNQFRVTLAPNLRAIVYGLCPDCVHSHALRHRDKVTAPFGYRPKSPLNKRPPRPHPRPPTRKHELARPLLIRLTSRLTTASGSVYVATVWGFHENSSFCAGWSPLIVPLGAFVAAYNVSLPLSFLHHDP